MAAIIAVLAAIPFISASDAITSEDGTEYDEDLGQFWSYSIRFSYTGYDATSVTWDFGDGSEEVEGYSATHTFPDTGYFYVTQTATNYQGDSIAVYRVQVMGFPYIEFVSNGGSDVDRINMTSGGINAVAAEKPDDPVRAGYQFNGWYTDEGCTVAYDWSRTVSVPVTLYAGWTENPSYNVTFDVGGGSVQLDPVPVIGGLTYELPAYEGTYEGHIFGGWLVDGQTYLPGQSITVNGPVTVTAVWNLDSYTVSFETEGGVPVPDSQIIPYGSTATEPDFTPERTGYTFVGWYLNGEPFDFDTVIEGNITLTAHWTPIQITVTFDPDNGESTWTESVAYGTAVSEPAEDPERSNYRFVGWYLGDSPYVFSTAVTQAITITAHWEYVYVPPQYDTYRVTFDADGGEPEPPSTTVREGRTVAEPETDPEKTGYTFSGWYLGDTLYDFDTPVNGDITLTAHWTPLQYQVTFAPDNGTYPWQETVSHGSTITEPDEPTYAGHTFDGWYLGDEPYDFETPVTGPITLTAHWTSNPVTDEVHTVTYDLGHDSVTQTMTVKDGSRAVSFTPDCEGFVFVAWFQNGMEYDFSEPVRGDITLTAGWREIVQITIGGDNDGSFTLTDTEVSEGDAIRLPEGSRDGEKVVGWDTDGNGEVDAYPGDIIEITEDTVLVPEWGPVEGDQHEIIIEGTQDGDLPIDSWYTDGDETFELPDIPPRDGQVLDGWIVNGNEDETVATGTPVEITEDTTIEAVWRDAEDVEVTIDVGDSEDIVISGTIPDDLKEGDEFVLPDASRPGYEFAGWDLDGIEGVDAYPGDTITVTEDTVLKPVFDELAGDDVQHEIVIDADGGSSDVDVWYPVDGEAVPLPEPSKDGSGFVGWDTDGDGVADVMPGQEWRPVSDGTVKAVWSEHPEEEPSIWFLVGAGIALVLAALAFVFVSKTRDEFVLIAGIALVVIAVVCLLFYGGVI